ncbi:SGT1-domain-containing protein [Hypoxylon sp. NC1633]|nr:SGT1-domain-containing protein [Hypoxylon sp. NC1633]
MDFRVNDQSPGDGIGELPKRLPENYVEYLLFILDDKLEARSLLSELEAIRKTALQLCDTVVQEYIWQRDSFHLRIERDQNLTYLRGTTDYGDSVEDEWLIVYLLRELTRSFPTLWVRVFDSDGEFLLVEAANVLPKWLSPEIDTNRAWIHRGRFHLIPLAASSGVKRPLSLVEAIRYAKSDADGLVHSNLVQAEAFYRLEKYPRQITDSIHRSLVTIPRRLAYILHENPSTIAPAVEAFYLRDPDAMKALASVSGNMHFPPNDLVTVGVKFTKVLFAQLKSQQFSPPPIWSPVLEAAEKRASDEDYVERALAHLEMGMKVASGFEMLATNADKKDNRLAREFAMLLEDLDEDGAEILPTNQDIEAWEGARKEDDESWLDINFEDFENELRGNRGSRQGTKGGFGDSSTQADLRKIVSRFEAFLNDEDAGIEGAEMEDMDEDDDVSDNNEDSGDDDDKEVSLDEEQFSRLMRGIIGTPATEPTNLEDKSGDSYYVAAPDTLRGKGVAGDEDEDEDIKQLAAQMEAELKRHGALKLYTELGDPKAIDSREGTVSKGEGKDNPGQGTNNREESGDEEVDVDYNLAKNLLESFKSQAGMAGPAGNILGMMGLQLPRDEDEDEEDNYLHTSVQ